MADEKTGSEAEAHETVTHGGSSVTTPKSDQQKEITNFEDRKTGEKYQIETETYKAVQSKIVEELTRQGLILKPEESERLKRLEENALKSQTDLEKSEREKLKAQGKQEEVWEKERISLAERIAKLEKQDKEKQEKLEYYAKKEHEEKVQYDILDIAKKEFPNLNLKAVMDPLFIKGFIKMFTYDNSGKLAISDGNGGYLKDESGILPRDAIEYLKDQINSRPYLLTATGTQTSKTASTQSGAVSLSSGNPTVDMIKKMNSTLNYKD